ncbi:MAG: capsular biosynthesis protein [Rhodobacteraceae bacterium]|nr:capsular biosynthesis protein [Paracoccaceae bacterium]
MSADKKFLFLQGPPNGYWSVLGHALQNAGQGVCKINLCLADQVFWRGLPADNYRGRFKNWPEWLAGYIAKHGITDIIYYADQHPYHCAARQVAKLSGVKCWAIEFGYLRPDWLTLEQDGMGPLSHFPRSRPEIEALARPLADPDMRCKYPHKFIDEALGEVVFHLLQSFGRPFYPWFKSDKTYWPAIDYLSWLPEFMRGRGQKKQARKVESQVLRQQTPYWLVALQIHADYQIRSHCDFSHQEQMLADVFRSFKASGASGDLVIKTHPLDNGLENWPKRVARLAARYGLNGRVHLIKGGDLGGLIQSARGVIVANSTVGLHSIAAGIPTLTLGRALFDIAGLTHQSGLSEFWHNPQMPDAEFFKTYRRALTNIQIKGSFYNPDGQAAAAQEMVQRLTKPAKDTEKPLQQVDETIIIAAE